MSDATPAEEQKLHAISKAHRDAVQSAVTHLNCDAETIAQLQAMAGAWTCPPLLWVVDLASPIGQPPPKGAPRTLARVQYVGGYVDLSGMVWREKLYKWLKCSVRKYACGEDIVMLDSREYWFTHADRGDHIEVFLVPRDYAELCLNASGLKIEID
jgi:hypothetical protein